jgi:peroxiredoxin
MARAGRGGAAGRAPLAAAGILVAAGVLAAAAPARDRDRLEVAGMALEIRDGRVVVAEVTPGSAAAAAGLLPLDVIVVVDDRNVVDLQPLAPREVLDLFRDPGRREIRLVVGRGAGTFAAALRPGEAKAPAAVGPPPEGVRPGDPAPPFAGRDLQGREVSLRALRGKVVLVDFWASWCAPCRATGLTVRRLAAEHADTLVVVGVSLDDDSRAYEAFVRNHQLPGHQIFDNGRSGPIAARYGVAAAGIPYAVVVDAEGRVAEAGGSFDAIEAAIRRLVQPAGR